MNSQIDFRTVPANVPSLCIPRVYPNISEVRIRKIFDELALGAIDHLDIISKTTEKGEKFNRVFIHFRSWYTDGNAGVARERLLNGKDIKIIYDDPWFWKVSAYREQASAARPEPRQQQNHVQKKPTILFEDSDDNKQPRKQYQDQRPRPGSSYDDDRRIKQTPTRKEHVQKERPTRPESSGFKKVSKADMEDIQGPERRPIARALAPALKVEPPTIIAPALSTIAPALKVEPPTIIAPDLKVETEEAVEIKKEKDEDETLKQKVPPKKKLRAIAKKPILLKVEETKPDPVTIKQEPEEQNELEEGEIV